MNCGYCAGPQCMCYPVMRPLEYSCTSGTFIKPSLCEAGEQVAFPLEVNGGGGHTAELLSSLAMLSPRTDMSAFNVPKNHAQTFSVGIDPTTVIAVSRQKAGIFFSLNTHNISVDAIVCAVHVRVVADQVTGTLMREVTVPVCCPRGFVNLTVPWPEAGGHVSVLPKGVAYVKYRFSDC